MQVFDKHQSALGRYIDESVFAILAGHYSNAIGSKVDVADLYVANLLISHTRIRQKANDGLLTDILGTLQNARHLRLSQNVFEDSLRFARPTQTNPATLHGTEVLKRNAGVNDVVIAVMPVMHPVNVALNVLMGGDKLSHATKRNAQAAAVSLDSGFTQSVVND